jgi:hypothetical protein
MVKYLRILTVFLLVGLLVSQIIVPVYALDSSPSELKINAVNVYQSVLESGDMAFLTDFTVRYDAGTVTDDVGTVLGSPLPLVIGLNTVNVVGLGDITVFLPSGSTGTATSGTCTVAGSPVALVGGTQTIIAGGAVGTIYIYVNPPSASVETITDTYNVRLMDGATEIMSVAPYAYYNRGFDRGITWMYFSAAEVIAEGLSWGGAYTMRLDGNPTATWTGVGTIPPAATPKADFNWKPSTTLGVTKLLLTTDIRTEAVAITNDWDDATYVLYSTTTAGKLSTSGETYFTAIIPNLSDLAPDLFTSITLTMDIITPMATKNKYANEIGSDFQGTKYETGTATFTYNSATVTGSIAPAVPTAWAATMIGGMIKSNTDGAFYIIQSVPAVNTITLTTPYLATGGIGHDYTIYYLQNTPPGATSGALPPLSLLPAADALHIPVLVFGVIICIGVILFVMVHGCGAANSYRPAILIVLPLLYVFTRFGFFPLGLTIGIGLFAAFAIWYTFFYQPSSL